ncbi:MAG: type II secretion system secretin GspD [Hyphomicrobiaceae bacterium]
MQPNRLGKVRSLAVAAVVCAPLLVGCTLPYEQLSLPAPVDGSAGGKGDGRLNTGAGAPLSGPGAKAALGPRNYPGSGDFTNTTAPKTSAAGTAAVGGAETAALPSPASAVNKDGITLNLVGASVAEVAKTVLGDVMGVNYTVSDKVKATITLRTSRPVEKAGLLAIFESVLREEGAAIVVEGDLYKIVPSSDATAAGAPLRPRKGPRQAAGVATEIVPLRFVAAAEMERILKSAAPQAGVLRVDAARNMLMLSGTRTELASMGEMINVFDVDTMRGMSFGIYPVETSDPEAIAQELDTIFANDKDGPTKGMVRFVPNKRLKSVMAITSRPEYLRKAETWLKRIDLASRATEKQVFVYHVQHRPASELSTILQKVYQQKAGASATVALSTARSQGGAAGTGTEVPVPGFGVAGGVGTATGFGASGGSTVGVAPVPAVGGTDAAKIAEAAAAVAGDGATLTTASVDASRTNGNVPLDDRAAGISVVADEIKNSLIITATAAEYRRVKQVLAGVDIEANQVLLEATIAEVTLNDNLKFGVRAFIGGGGSNATSNSSLPTNLLALPLAANPVAAAGFQYFLNAKNLQVVLNALSAVTNVNVVSSPSLMVMENKRATLQVGDEVPIITQTGQGVQAPGAPIINSVSYRSTGIILGITPRLSDDGRVFLDIEQEVSNVASTSVNGPTISQRRVKTTVTVNDGETIVLAGLMKDDATRDRQQVPLLGDIPLFGNAFKSKDDTIKRTELLISITPQVIRDRHQIDDVTAEYRDNLNFSTRPQRRAAPDRREQIDRLIR